jgi:hypothetical protein
MVPGPSVDSSKFILHAMTPTEHRTLSGPRVSTACSGVQKSTVTNTAAIPLSIRCQPTLAPLRAFASTVQWCNYLLEGTEKAHRRLPRTTKDDIPEELNRMLATSRPRLADFDHPVRAQALTPIHLFYS